MCIKLLYQRTHCISFFREIIRKYKDANENNSVHNYPSVEEGRLVTEFMKSIKEGNSKQSRSQTVRQRLLILLENVY